MVTSTALSTLTSSIAGFDVFIFAFLLGGAALFGLSLGRDRIIGMIFATYIAAAVLFGVTGIDAAANALHLPGAYARVIVFFVVFALAFFQIIRRSILSAIGSSSRWWQTILLSVFHVGMLISVTLQLLPAEMTSGLSDLTKMTFLGDLGRSLWLILPMLGILFLPNG